MSTFRTVLSFASWFYREEWPVKGVLKYWGAFIFKSGIHQAISHARHLQKIDDLLALADRQLKGL